MMGNAFSVNSIRLSGHHTWNDLATMAAINAEVSIRCDDDRIGERLTHPDETRVGKAHRNVGVLLHEDEHTVEFVAQIERRNDCTAAKKRTECRLSRRSEEVE